LKPAIARIVTTLLVAFSTVLWSGSAAALWLGLADGDYDVTLTSCNSGVPGLCATLPITGQITVSGPGLSFMDITIDGVTFTGDPVDFVQTDFLISGDNRERSSVINNAPFAFFSLLHATGAVVAPNFPADGWIYCSNNPNGTCSPNTIGAWVATPRAVPEPTTLLLLGLGIAGLGFARRRQTH